jgi:CheY-like chemotaxis protein
VFHPFFTTKKEGRGTGLGLTMVDNIIRNHGGEIWIDSRLGKGTSVYVVLPAMDPKLDLEIMEEGTAPTLETGRETLMIVDDESMIRDNFVSIFSELGYTVFCAANGEEALELFRERPEVRLVILDLVMPRKDGLETYREMKLMRPDLKVILTSGYKDDPRIQTLREEGIDFLLKKPYSIEEISGVIKKLLA